MSAITQMLAVTSVTCDAPKCKTTHKEFGKSFHARTGAQKRGWRCDDVRREDFCPVHVELAAAPKPGKS